jgi:predicted amidophosphoribosyltransferase
MTDVVSRPDVVCLVPVPGDAERAWKRGDVPPARLATELGRIWELPVADVLERNRVLPRQRGLSLDERRRNVRGSVVARAAVPCAVCLVDDVYTSGATADACAKASRRVGARWVQVVTLARAVR